jgi:hypothetical protein
MHVWWHLPAVPAASAALASLLWLAAQWLDSASPHPSTGAKRPYQSLCAFSQRMASQAVTSQSSHPPLTLQCPPPSHREQQEELLKRKNQETLARLTAKSGGGAGGLASTSGRVVSEALAYRTLTEMPLMRQLQIEVRGMTRQRTCTHRLAVMTRLTRPVAPCRSPCCPLGAVESVGLPIPQTTGNCRPTCRSHRTS